LANTLLTISQITREAVRLWKNSNAFIQNIDTQYDSSYAQSGAKIGSNLRIRLPSDFVVVDGPGLSVQDTQEQSVTLVLASQKHIDVSFNSVDRTLSLDDYAKRVLAPMVNKLAGAVAVDVMRGAEGGVANFVANQDASNNILSPIASTFLNAGATLDMGSAPDSDRRIVNSPVTDARTVSSLAGLFNPVEEISTQYRTGRMRDALGFLWMKDQTVLQHTTGTLGQSSATVNGANQSGLNLSVSPLPGSLNLGDIITITGVYETNRITNQNTGRLRQFVVTGNIPAGSGVIPIYPALIAPISGQAVQYQTVNAAPANGAAVNPAAGLAPGTTYRKNLAFVPEAVTFATADLELPGGVHEAAREEFDGISMRMITDYFMGTDQLITRLDVLYGYLWIRPEWAVVVADQP
jgi:hypothetical protein